LKVIAYPQKATPVIYYLVNASPQFPSNQLSLLYHYARETSNEIMHQTVHATVYVPKNRSLWWRWSVKHVSF